MFKKKKEKKLSAEEIAAVAAERNRLVNEQWEEWKRNNPEKVPPRKWDATYEYSLDGKKLEGHLSQALSEWAANRPEANYETIDMVQSDDPVVLNFLRSLGITPEATRRVTIVAEENKVLQIAVEGYAVSGRSTGSDLTNHPKPFPGQKMSG